MASQNKYACPQTAKDRTSRIARLNDLLRKGRTQGRVFITEGILSLGDSAAEDVMAQVRDCDNFSQSNDPHGEHDFGSFDHRGHKVFWKIDYYDSTLQFGSEDPANSAITCRVLTVMLAREY